MLKLVPVSKMAWAIMAGEMAAHLCCSSRARVLDLDGVLMSLECVCYINFGPVCIGRTLGDGGIEKGDERYLQTAFSTA